MITVPTNKEVIQLSTQLLLKFLNMLLSLQISCRVSWGCRIHRLPLCRGVRPPPTNVQDRTLNNLMVRFQWCWSFGECGAPFPFYHPQVHSGPIYGLNRTKMCTYAELNCFYLNCLTELNNLKWKYFWQLDCVPMLNWKAWNRTILTFNCVDQIYIHTKLNCLN